MSDAVVVSDDCCCSGISVNCCDAHFGLSQSLYINFGNHGQYWAQCYDFLFHSKPFIWDPVWSMWRYVGTQCAQGIPTFCCSITAGMWITNVSFNGAYCIFLQAFIGLPGGTSAAFCSSFIFGTTCPLLRGWTFDPLYLEFGNGLITVTDTYDGPGIVPFYREGPQAGRTPPPTLFATLELVWGNGACAVGTYPLNWRKGEWSFRSTGTCNCLGINHAIVPADLIIEVFIPTGCGFTCRPYQDQDGNWVGGGPGDVPTCNLISVGAGCGGSWQSFNVPITIGAPVFAVIPEFVFILSCCFPDPNNPNLPVTAAFKITITE